MFSSYNEKTNERVDSLSLLENPKYQYPEEEKWYADPNQIESFDESKVKDVTKIRTIYVKEKDVINYKGTKFTCSPHFRIPNASELGINVIPESKEHRIAKNWIYNVLIQNKLKFAYSKINKPFKYQNIVEQKELPINKQLIGIEAGLRDRNSARRVDVICPFHIKHPILGDGIVFEIQLSRQRKDVTERRTIERAIQGFSTAWLTWEDFEQISDEIICLKSDIIKVDSFISQIHYNSKFFIRNLKTVTEEQTRMITQAQTVLRFWVDGFINECGESLKEIIKVLISKEYEDKKELLDLLDKQISEKKDILLSKPKCPVHDVEMELRPKRNPTFWGCPFYFETGCKCTSPLNKDVLDKFKGYYGIKDGDFFA